MRSDRRGALFRVRLRVTDARAGALRGRAGLAEVRRGLSDFVRRGDGRVAARLGLLYCFIIEATSLRRRAIRDIVLFGILAVVTACNMFMFARDPL